jgi:rhodanese-related sulfurtransferase
MHSFVSIVSILAILILFISSWSYGVKLEDTDLASEVSEVQGENPNEVSDSTNGNLNITQKLSDLVLEGQSYEDIKTITMDEVLSNYKKLLIIDPREFYEYKVLNIKGSINRPLSSLNPSVIKKLMNIGNAEGIVFYSNGKNSSIAHRAANKSFLWGNEFTYVLEDGIFELAIKYPQAISYDGKLLQDFPKEVMGDWFNGANKHFLGIDEFQQISQRQDYMIIDVRPRHERKAELVSFRNQKVIGFDQVVRYLYQKNSPLPQKLLIYDTDEHQCILLYHYLIENKFSDFYFLKGGVINNSSLTNYIKVLE